MTPNQPLSDKPTVVFVPGGVMPAEMAYGPVLAALATLAAIGEEIRPIPKELEVYATEAPPPNYGLELEVDGIARAADAAGAERFHLVGYSAGGAPSLAFVARYPERVRSLALIEPAWIGKITAADAADWDALTRVMSLPPDERMPAFARWQMRQGVEPPKLPLPPGPPPPWMAKRPAGLEAFIRAFNTYELDQERFRLFRGPVYYALGTLSTRYYERAAKTLARLFADFRLEEYEGRSHFDPPHRAEPRRFAEALRALWSKA